jgi:hypothetical protein
MICDFESSLANSFIGTVTAILGGCSEDHDENETYPVHLKYLCWHTKYYRPYPDMDGIADQRTFTEYGKKIKPLACILWLFFEF